MLDGATKKALEIGRNRLLVGALLFAMAFLVIVGRLVDVSLLQDLGEPRLADQTPAAPVAERADITDRNGVILATSLATFSLFANPAQVLDADEAAKELAGVLPDLSVAELEAKLATEGIGTGSLDRVKPPAGLDLGAITPEEIALSILAEITLERRRGQRGQAAISPSRD